MRGLALIIIFLMFESGMAAKKLKEGIYRGVLFLDEEKNIELPFNFTVEYKGKNPRIIIMNSDERIVVDEITIRGDSVKFKMPVFDTEFKALMVGTGLEGYWINNYRTTKNKIKFKATYGESKRFLFTPGKVDPLFEGKWEVTFSPGIKDSSKAIGIFHHQEQTDYVSGTFLTETGDYRYLEGMRHENKLYLSAFDGSHAFLFLIENRGGDLIEGIFYSGAHHSEKLIGKKNDAFKLRNANEITITVNNEKLNFSFPDLDNKTVTLDDKKYANKPVIVQLLGTWCPNCMDECRYLKQLYNQYKSQGLEIVGLAFEKTTDREKAVQLIKRLKQRLNIDYEILVTGQTGKEKASESFRSLNGITAFPTTIFLNKEHRIVRIHTGFNGPATGKEYDTFKEETEKLVDKLIAE
jgi:thiol-disulfide isomerase/thioredoxin